MSTYLKPKQQDITKIASSVIEAISNNVPQVEVLPIIDVLFDKFLCESFPKEYITIGINILREMLERNPSLIEWSHYSAVCDLAEVKNKSVKVAVKSVINLIRDVNPDLIEHKENRKNTLHEKLDHSIDGIDLLKYQEGYSQNYNLECNELLTDKQLKN